LHGLVGGWEDGGGRGKGGVVVVGFLLSQLGRNARVGLFGQGVCVNDRFSIFVCLDGWSSCQVLVPQSRFPPSKIQLKSSFPLIPTLFSPASSSIFDPSLMLHPYRPPSAPNPPPTSTALSSVTPNHIPSTRNHPRALESLKRLEPRRNRINLFQEPR